MKKLLLLMLILFLGYVIYFDLTEGTIPNENLTIQGNPKIEKEIESIETSSSTKRLNYFLYEVKSGDTVLSIVEKENSGLRNMSIQKIVEDFERLNPNANANSIQLGREYFFPIYSVTKKE